MSKAEIFSSGDVSVSGALIFLFFPHVSTEESGPPQIMDSVYPPSLGLSAKQAFFFIFKPTTAPMAPRMTITMMGAILKRVE